MICVFRFLSNYFEKKYEIQPKSNPIINPKPHKLRAAVQSVHAFVHLFDEQYQGKDIWVSHINAKFSPSFMRRQTYYFAFLDTRNFDIVLLTHT